MSPEQARGLSDIDHRSDIWSLCVVLYEALSGRVPFEAPNCPALLRSIIDDALVPLDALGVDAELATLVQRGLEKDRDRRYSSMLELGRALAAWLVEQGVQEDVTGAFVTAKWQARSSHRAAWPKRSQIRRRTAEAEGGTLISVVQPESQPSEMREGRRQPRRAWRWLPKAAAAMLALAAAALGGGVLASPAPSAAPMAATLVAPAAAAAPAMPTRAATSVTEAPRAPSETPASPPVAGTTKRTSPIKLASTVSQPAADPKQGLVAPNRDPLDPKRDLMDPYR